MTDPAPPPAPEDACTECGQPPHRHTAPAFADHVHQPPATITDQEEEA